MNEGKNKELVLFTQHLWKTMEDGMESDACQGQPNCYKTGWEEGI